VPGSGKSLKPWTSHDAHLCFVVRQGPVRGELDLGLAIGAAWKRGQRWNPVGLGGDGDLLAERLGGGGAGVARRRRGWGCAAAAVGREYLATEREESGGGVRGGPACRSRGWGAWWTYSRRTEFSYSTAIKIPVGYINCVRHVYLWCLHDDHKP
jgi:hypothetical protein